MIKLGNKPLLLVYIVILIFVVGAVGGIFLWSILSGQFKDVERPKHRMLDLDKKTGVKDE